MAAKAPNRSNTIFSICTDHWCANVFAVPGPTELFAIRTFLVQTWLISLDTRRVGRVDYRHGELDYVSI